MTSSCRTSLTKRLCGVPTTRSRLSLSFCALSGLITSATAAMDVSSRLICVPPYEVVQPSDQTVPNGLLNLDQRFRRCAIQHCRSIFRCEAFHLRRDVHGAELGTAHRTEMRILEALLRQRLIV